MNKNGGQQMRVSDDELQLIKATFVENDELLKAMRKAFLGIELTDTEKFNLNVLDKPSIKLLLRKIFLPEISGNEPLGQVIDLWMTVELKDKTTEQATLLLNARDGLIELIERGLKAVSSVSPEIGMINFEVGKTTVAKAKHIEIIARNTLITHVEQQLLMLKTLAGLKKETPKETKERLSKDSAK